MSDRPEPPFLLDVMLGKLAVYLRLCGYDTVYALDRDVEADDAVLELAEREGRTVLTRDVHLSNRAERGFLLTERDPLDQLAELAAAGLRLEPTDEPVRCGRCNGEMVAVGGDEVTPKYAPDPTDTAQWRCTACGQVFWKGSHWDRMRETLREVRES
ncbi:Mut7-C RNAse domain-containing protein [Salinirubellus salinus]